LIRLRDKRKKKDGKWYHRECALNFRKLLQPGTPLTFFEVFCSEVKALMEGPVVQMKGYNSSGVDGPNELDKLIHSHFPGHSLGEVVYKCIRFKAKGDITDLEKAAAWLFLEWRNSLSGPKPPTH